MAPKRARVQVNKAAEEEFTDSTEDDSPAESDSRDSEYAPDMDEDEEVDDASGAGDELDDDGDEDAFAKQYEDAEAYTDGDYVDEEEEMEADEEQGPVQDDQTWAVPAGGRRATAAEQVDVDDGGDGEGWEGEDGGDDDHPMEQEQQEGGADEYPDQQVPEGELDDPLAKPAPQLREEDMQRNPREVRDPDTGAPRPFRWDLYKGDAGVLEAAVRSGSAIIVGVRLGRLVHRKGQPRLYRMRLPRTASVLLVKRELSRRFSKGQVWPSFIRLRKVVHKKVPGPAGPAGAAAAAVQRLVELPDFAPVPEAGEGAGAAPPAPEASLNECGVGPGSELVIDVQWGDYFECLRVADRVHVARELWRQNERVAKARAAAEQQQRQQLLQQQQQQQRQQQQQQPQKRPLQQQQQQQQQQPQKRPLQQGRPQQPRRWEDSPLQQRRGGAAGVTAAAAGAADAGGAGGAYGAYGATAATAPVRSPVRAGGQTRRPRQSWSVEETCTFLRYMLLEECGMSWSAVIHYDTERGGGVLASRTPRDLKDRWRNLMKHVDDGFSNISARAASTGLRDRQLQELARRAYERYKEYTRQWPLG